VSLGRRLSTVLKSLELSRSTYYSWKKRIEGKPATKEAPKPHPLQLTPGEKKMIVDTKEELPACRHRQIQGILQNRGVYVSESSVFKVLKENGLIERFERREAPWKKPHYEIRGRCLVWGSDWTKIKIDHQTWHLLTVIDFFSRYLVAFDIVPSVNASHVKQIYDRARHEQGLPKGAMPKLRVDQGSPNTSLVTKEFFKLMGSELSWARVRRPTDNAITERFYGTIKQEEIYLVGSYPDIVSAREEITKYIEYYNTRRPHQALWNFVPAHVHAVNNKSLILAELQELKFLARRRRQEYWSLFDTYQMQRKLYPELTKNSAFDITPI